MAEEMFVFWVTAGIFAFLVAVLFGSRARRKDRDQIINKRLTSYNNHMVKLSLKDVGQTWLALLIIVPAFALIAYMLLIQQSTINDALLSVRGLNSNAATPDTRIATLTGFYREMNQANQNMFALMTTVFGAWVAAVVAFYFGTKSQAKTQDALEKALSPKEKKLSGMTVQQLLDEYPIAKEVEKVDMQTKIGKVKKIFKDKKDLTNVLVVGDDERPRGLLYSADLRELPNVRDNVREIEDPTYDALMLKERITNITDDFVTHSPWNPTPWNPTTGVKNYAELLLTDNLQIAQSAMQAKADGPKVRGVVLDTQGKVVGIVDYTMISSILQKE
jgi:hypothetical protein